MGGRISGEGKNIIRQKSILKRSEAVKKLSKEISQDLSH